MASQESTVKEDRVSDREAIKGHAVILVCGGNEESLKGTSDALIASKEGLCVARTISECSNYQLCPSHSFVLQSLHFLWHPKAVQSVASRKDVYYLEPEEMVGLIFFKEINEDLLKGILFVKPGCLTSSASLQASENPLPPAWFCFFFFSEKKIRVDISRDFFSAHSTSVS